MGKSDDTKSEGTPILRPDGFRKTYGTRVLVSMTEYDFRAIIANEKLCDDDGGEFYLGENMIILTPLAAKELHKELGRNLKEWEKEFGKISKRPQTQKYSEQAIKE